MELPASGAVSLATLHSKQWKAADLSDGDSSNRPWGAAGWQPWTTSAGQGPPGDLWKMGLPGAPAVGPAELKEYGNAAYLAGEYDSALVWYTKVIDGPTAEAATVAETCRLNRAACCLALGRFQDAADDCTAVLEQPVPLLRRHRHAGRQGTLLHIPSPGLNPALLCWEVRTGTDGHRGGAGRRSEPEGALPPRPRQGTSRSPVLIYPPRIPRGVNRRRRAAGGPRGAGPGTGRPAGSGGSGPS
jgi:hypothetical protein